MTIRAIVVLLVGLTLASVHLAEAQQSKKVARIAYLGLGAPQLPGREPAPGAQVRLGALRQGLRELGYKEEKNIIIEYRTAAGKRERIPELLAELARLKTDVIIWAAGQEGAKQVKTIPIVYVATSDFVATGLVKSLARPGGNITGITSLAPELGGKPVRASQGDGSEALPSGVSIRSR
jgi:putative ABC transport system substrate-binding protein